MFQRSRTRTRLKHNGRPPFAIRFTPLALASLALLAGGCGHAPRSQPPAAAAVRAVATSNDYKGAARHPPGEIQKASKLALVIGNDYRGETATRPLKNPVNDALAMKQVLEQSGFEVIYLENADLSEMETKRDEFASRLDQKPGSIALFYFSGHGVQFHEHNFLIPAEARITTDVDLRNRAVDVDTVLDKLERAGTRMNFVILDACRDNPFKGMSKSLIGKGLASITSTPRGTLVAYATQVNNVASDNVDEANGLYTKFLIQFLRQKGLGAEQMFKRVREEVRKASEAKKQQPPQIPTDVSTLEGHFCFAGCEVPAASDQTPSATPTASPTAPPSPESQAPLAEAERLYFDKNYAAAIPLYRKIAESPGMDQGHAEFRIGALYANGWGVKLDVREAAKWMQKAANRGHPLGLRWMAKAYKFGYGTRQDKLYSEELKRLSMEKGFQQMAESLDRQGDPVGQVMLGWYYREVNKTNEEVEQYRKAALNEEVVAQGNYGFALLKGMAGLAKDQAAAMKWYEKAASRGDPLAQTYLGDFYINYATGDGKGVGSFTAAPFDAHKAEEWYRRAAAQEYPEAEIRLGMLAQSVEVSREAEGWFLKAANHGSTQAEFMLFELYAGEDSSLRNPAKAREWLTRAAEHGVAQAQAVLAQRYEEGDFGFDRNPAQAAFWYRKAADQGNAGAQVNLGLMYEKGSGGLPQDKKEARGLYEQAARQGVAQAERNLKVMDGKQTDADLLQSAEEVLAGRATITNTEALFKLGLRYYRGGSPFPRDPAKAARLFRMAADRGDRDALLALGQMLANGEVGGEPQVREAAALFRQAADQGSPDAAWALYKLYASDQFGLKNPAEARRWLEAGAERGDARSIIGLSVVSWKGADGFPKNLDKARQLLRRGADSGKPPVQTALGAHLVWGSEVFPRDAAEARRWLGQAQSQGDKLAPVYLKLLDGQVEAADLKILADFIESSTYWLLPTDFLVRIGQYYQAGTPPFPRDVKRSAYFYDQAARQGNAAGQTELARMYQGGEGGLSQDPKKAKELYSQAAKQGFGPAEVFLKGIKQSPTTRLLWPDVLRLAEQYKRGSLMLRTHELYEIGRALHYGAPGLEQNPAEAFFFTEQSARPGYALAQAEMGRLYGEGVGVARDYGKALEWFQKAAAQGDAGAEYCIGVSYDQGWGVARDQAKAVEWYRKAANQGLADAQNNLAVHYEFGWGVRADRATALSWYRAAADNATDPAVQEKARKSLARLEGLKP